MDMIGKVLFFLGPIPAIMGLIHGSNSVWGAVGWVTTEGPGYLVATAAVFLAAIAAHIIWGNKPAQGA